jgi:hypothetical protein
MGQNHTKVVGTNLRLPKLQKDLREIYKSLNPGKTRQERIDFSATLNNETRIRTVIEEFEIEVFGRNTDTGLPNVGGGNNLPFRVERLKRELNLV